MRIPRTLTRTALLAALSLGAVACGDDGGEVAAGPDDAPVAEGGGCEVIDGNDRAADEMVDVVLDEWRIAVDTDEVAAGNVGFSVVNEGEDAHELVIVRAPADDLTVADGAVEEGELPAGAFIGEIEAFGSGQTCDGTFELEAGTYTLFCNIVEAEDDGEMESHYLEGMATTFTVG